MGEILGLGVNSYGKYVAGDMSSVSNARLTQMIDDPKKFTEMVQLCDLLDKKAKAKTFYLLMTHLDMTLLLFSHLK